MNAILQHHLEDHATCLDQFLNNDTQDHNILAELIVRILTRISKKAWIEHALAYINIDGVDGLESRLVAKFGEDLAAIIMQKVIVHISGEKPNKRGKRNA